MNIEEIKKENMIEQMDYYLDNIGNTQIDIMFVQKTQSRLNKYKTLMFNCNEKDIEGMVTETIQNMKHHFAKKEFDNYDLEVSLDDVVQVIEKEKEKVVNHEVLMDKITINYTDENTVGEETDFGKFNSLIIKLSGIDNNREPIIFYKKHYKSPAKFKNTCRYTFNGKEANPFHKELLIIGTNVEALCVGKYFYIVNRDNFNTMLDFKDIYNQVISSNEDKIIQSKVFENPEQFIDDCKGHGRHIVRLTKAILMGGFEGINNNKKKLPDILSRHKLKLKLGKQGELIYNKENIEEILNLLLEHYVTSDLTDKKLVAKAIAKYE